MSTTLTRIYDANGAVLNEDLAQLYDFAGALRRRWLVIVCGALLGTGLATALSYYMKPVYRGFATLAPVSPYSDPFGGSIENSLSEIGGTLVALTGAGGGLTDQDRETDEAMTVMESREFTQSFISDNDLLPVLFPKLWDPQERRWKPGVKVPTLERGFAVFDDIRKIDRNDDNDFVTIQIDWRDRTLAAKWANEIANRLNAEMRRRAIVGADASLEYLKKELASTSDVDTRESIARLMETEIRKKMMAHVTDEFALRFVDRALVPDADFPARPKKLILISAGFLLGALLGVAACLLAYRRELTDSGLL